jgi:hypothetical protein
VTFMGHLAGRQVDQDSRCLRSARGACDGGKGANGTRGRVETRFTASRGRPEEAKTCLSAPMQQRHWDHSPESVDNRCSLGNSYTFDLDISDRVLVSGRLPMYTKSTASEFSWRCPVAIEGEYQPGFQP